MRGKPFILVCFAVKEEAKPLNQLIRSQPGVWVLVTGMGRHNAETAIRTALAEERPRIVLSAGFAGGLNPAAMTVDALDLVGQHHALNRQPWRQQDLERMAAPRRRDRAHYREAGRLVIRARRDHQSWPPACLLAPNLWIEIQPDKIASLRGRH